MESGKLTSETERHSSEWEEERKQPVTNLSKQGNADRRRWFGLKGSLAHYLLIFVSYSGSVFNIRS